MAKEELIVPNAAHVYCERTAVREHNSYTHTKAILTPDKGRENRPYKCNKCTASFIDASECEEHKRKHSGDGPFTCEDCHFSFMYKTHYKSHKTRCMKKRASMTPAQLAAAANAAAASAATGLPKTVMLPAPVIKREFPTHQTAQATGATNTPARGKKRRMSAVETVKGTASRQYSTSNAESSDDYFTNVDDPPHYSPPQQFTGGSNDQGDGIEGFSNFNNIAGGANLNRVGASGSHSQSGSSNSRVTINKAAATGVGAASANVHKRIINPVNVKPEAELNTFNPGNPSFKRLRRQNNEHRPHECNECDASFTTDEDLAHHKQKHNGDGPFRCDSCQFVYLYRRLYDAHKRKCKKGKSKKDGPVGGGGAGGGDVVFDQSRNVIVANTAAAPSAATATVVVPAASVGGTVASSATVAGGGNSSSCGDGRETGQHQEQQQQQHVQFVQQHIQQQMQQLQQQQQQPNVTSNNSNLVQQQHPQIIYIDQQQQSKLTQQQQIDLSSLTQHGSVITLPSNQQHNGTNTAQQQQQQPFQILGPGGIQVLDTGSIVELRGQQLVAVGGAGIGGGDLKYELVQALDMDNVTQLMSLIKKGAVVSSGQ